MTDRAEPMQAFASREPGHTSVSQQEKASKWDFLIRTLRRPDIKDTHIRHLSTMQRATAMLLAYREELPTTLAAELKSYKEALDGLYLEAIDGFTDLEGVLNLLPTYVTESIAGELCQPDGADTR